MNTNLVPGSLSAIAAQQGASIAEAFIGANYIILVDTSGSMEQADALIVGWELKRGPTRYEAACQELAKLQGSLPGKIAVISFSSTAIFCPGGVPTLLSASTNLAGALEFVHIADGLVEKFIVISDGHPDNAEQALRQAKRFTSIIDSIFIGPEGNPGAEFMRQLAAASGGRAMKGKASEIHDQAQQLLLAAS